MNREKTISNASVVDSAKKSWYLSLKSPSPKQTLTIQFSDGRAYKYLGVGKVKTGDIVLIDYGGATSYMMGNVSVAEEGITINRFKALKPLFSFSTNPSKPEIKKNAEGMRCLEEIAEVAGYFNPPYSLCNEEVFRIVDYLVLGVLNAITVVAFPDLTTPGTVKEAKEFLAKEKPIPGHIFGKEFTDKYYGYYASGLRFADRAEVALTGLYPGWDEDLLNCAFWASEEYKNLKIEAEWNDNKTAYYLYFTNGSKKRAKYFAECAEFRAITNELVFRSALSVLIRGGCVNLLKAALSVEMPIKGFYRKLIAFADEIGSTSCAALLKSVDYERMSFPKEKEESEQKGKAKKTSCSKEFKIRDDVLVQYLGKEAIVTIPEGIKTIDAPGFHKNAYVKKVIVPDSVTSIKPFAFSNCPNLEEVVLGKKVSSIGRCCFIECKSLHSVDLSNTKIKVLNDSMFDSCTALKSVDLSRTKITAIKEDAFLKCSSLESVVLPETLKTIGSLAFCDTAISELIVPASVEKIAEAAFFRYFYGRILSLPEKHIRKLVFNGKAPIDFKLDCISADCVVCCTSDSRLWFKFGMDNDNLEKLLRQTGRKEYTPRLIMAL